MFKNNHLFYFFEKHPIYRLYLVLHPKQNEPSYLQLSFRRFHRLILRSSENLVPDEGDGDGHQRGDDVEQTIGQEFQRGHFQHR